MTMSTVELQHKLKPFNHNQLPQEELTKQQQLHVDALHTVDPLVASEAEYHLAAQIAHCASQHHSSEYNIVKFGPQGKNLHRNAKSSRLVQGSPTTYIPVSIQVPSHIQELKRRQSEFTDQDPWWLAHPSLSSPSHHSERKLLRLSQSPPKRLSPREEDNEVEMVIEESITSTSRVQSPKGVLMDLAAAAIDPASGSDVALLPKQHCITSSSLKTSHSHPINISSIIPLELLPIISAHLQPSELLIPTVFDLPHNMRLDRLTMPPTRSFLPVNEQSIRTPFVPTSLNTLYSNGIGIGIDAAVQMYTRPPPNPPPTVIWNPSSLTSPLEAIESPLISGPCSSPSISNNSPSSFDEKYTEIGSTDVDATPEPSLTPLPTPLLPVSSHSHTPPPTLPSATNGFHNTSVNASLAFPEPIQQNSTPKLLSLSPSLNQNSNGTSKNPPASAPPRFPPAMLGNLLLSSCPGKKVRLKGPVKGRGAICRDLGTDLERIARMGVKCVVCCLDDEELEFLGAKWTDYSHLARQNSLDVLRVPMPEGLTPHAIAPFNYAMDILIQKYTLKGIPVLVHCRGGVGRAGLVACCWIIKVGLCGWMDGASTGPSSFVGAINGCSSVEQVINGVEIPIVPIVPSQGPQASTTTNGVLTKPDMEGTNSPPISHIDTDASFIPTPCQSQTLNLFTSQTQDFSIIDASSPSPSTQNDTHPRSPSPCTPITSPTSPYTPSANGNTSAVAEVVKVPPDTLDLVQRAIAVVRRRRSVKAIETYEQVKFLVEFVEFLKSGDSGDETGNFWNASKP